VPIRHHLLPFLAVLLLWLLRYLMLLLLRGKWWWWWWWWWWQTELLRLVIAKVAPRLLLGPPEHRHIDAAVLVPTTELERLGAMKEVREEEDRAVVAIVDVCELVPRDFGELRGGPVRVRVEIMRSQKYRNARKDQSVLHHHHPHP
jgi:hypothetical protein